MFGMIRYTLIGLLLGLSNWTIGQSIDDSRLVIQMSIDLDELQPYFHEDKAEGRIPLVIYNDGIIPTDLRLLKFGEPVHFMTKAELFFYNKEAFLDFDKFDISPTQADITFRYQIEGLTVLLTLENVDGSWTVKTKELIEN